MRDDRGQTTAEYLGGLVLVSAIVAALLIAGTAEAIAGGIKETICRIAGQDCAQPARPDEHPPGPPDSDLEGPPLTGEPLVVLPFPGSVTVTCTYDRRDPAHCVPHGNPGVYVQTSGEIRIERTPTALDANGCPLQTASIGAKFQLTANAEARGARAGGTLQAYLGQNTTFQVMTSPDQMDAIAGGDRPAPNPIDPRTIGPGESVTLTEEFYAGINASGSYRALQAEMGYDRGRRVSSAVKRISPTTVRVMVGDSDFVREALKLGLGYKDVSVSLGNTKDLADGNLHSVDIDISTQAGWDAYQQFLSSGRLPRTGTPGTSDQARAQTIVYTDVTQIEAKLGGLKLGGRVNDSEGRLTVTTNEDGTVDTVVFGRYGDVGIAVTKKESASGTVIGSPTRSLLLEGLHSSQVEDLYQLTGTETPADPDGHVRLDFTERQLEQIRQVALNRLADRIAMNGERPSPEEIEDSIHNGVIEIDGVQYAFAGVESLLAEARTPEETLMALYHGGSGSGAVADSLTALLRENPTRLDIIATPEC